MATFKAEVQRHQKRRDGLYPVAIRVTHNRRSIRIKTGLYASERQINKKTFEIKDAFIIARTNNTISTYRERLLRIDTEELNKMSVEALRANLTAYDIKIDYLAFCDEMIASNEKKYRSLKTTVTIIREMGYKVMSPEDVNTQFVEEFREYIDKRLWKVARVGADGRKIEAKLYKNKTKNELIMAISTSFNAMCSKYNSDFYTVIKHRPTFRLFEMEETKKKTLTREELRRFIAYQPDSSLQQLAKDICLLSFGLCGCNVRDLFIMKKSNYIAEYNILKYRRAKTKVPTAVMIPEQVKHLFDKYLNKGDGENLFNFGRYTKDTLLSSSISNALMPVSKKIGTENLTPYWFRHSWASIAFNECGASKDLVDMCLAHASSNKMADVYIKANWEAAHRLTQAVQDYVYG